MKLETEVIEELWMGIFDFEYASSKYRVSDLFKKKSVWEKAILPFIQEDMN